METKKKRVMKPKFTICDIPFTSVKECENYVRKILMETDETNSVQEKNLEAFNFLVELAKRHPSYEKKFRDFKDFKINRNALQQHKFELNIINNDDSITTISWITCCSGKPKPIKELFSEALRTSVRQQIIDFRRSANLSQCKLCSCTLLDKEIHIDHHEPHFCEIVKNFMKIYKDEIIIPERYDNMENTNELVFKEADNWIGELFSKYHLDNATLRVLCMNCNLSRAKHFYNTETIKPVRCLCIIEPSP